MTGAGRWLSGPPLVSGGAGDTEGIATGCGTTGDATSREGSTAGGSIVGDGGGVAFGLSIVRSRVPPVSRPRSDNEARSNTSSMLPTNPPTMWLFRSIGGRDPLPAGCHGRRDPQTNCVCERDRVPTDYARPDITDRGTSTISEFVKIRFAEENRAGGLQLPDDLSVLSRNPVFEQLACRRGANACGVDVVLQRDGNAVKGSTPIPPAAAPRPSHARQSEPAPP